MHTYVSTGVHYLKIIGDFKENWKMVCKAVKKVKKLPVIKRVMRNTVHDIVTIIYDVGWVLDL